HGGSGAATRIWRSAARPAADARRSPGTGRAAGQPAVAAETWKGTPQRPDGSVMVRIVLLLYPTVSGAWRATAPPIEGSSAVVIHAAFTTHDAEADPCHRGRRRKRREGESSHAEDGA